MNDYLYKQLNEGFNRRIKEIAFTDSHEQILNTNPDKPAVVGRIYSQDLRTYVTTYSIFERVENPESGDANPVLYALKHEKGWTFVSEYNRQIFWKRFKDLLKKFLADHQNEFDTTIVIPSSNKLNKSFMSEIESIAKEVGISHVSHGGLRTLSTEKIEDAVCSEGSFFRRYWKDSWEDKFELLRDYLDAMDRYNNGLFKYHIIDSKSGLRKSVINTLEVDTENYLLYSKFINGKNILIVDDSITYGQSINSAIHALSEMYVPKSVSVLTMFSELRKPDDYDSKWG